jgi:phosphate acetyltransferase
MLTTEGAATAPPSPAWAHEHLHSLVERARAHGTIAVAVAYPCDAPSMEAVHAAARAGLIEPLLVGPRTRMAAAAAQAGIPLEAFAVHDTLDDPRIAAHAAVALCVAGEAAALMKGALHSDDMLAAALESGAGLRTGRRASHTFVMDVPGMNRLLLITDCVVNIAPTLADKRDIAQNAIDVAHVLGIARPRVALLSAVETVNPAIPATAWGCAHPSCSPAAPTRLRAASPRARWPCSPPRHARASRRRRTSQHAARWNRW